MEKIKEKYGRYAINTRSQEEYDNLMKLFDDNDIGWYSGRKATYCDRWHRDEETTCVNIYCDGNITHSGISFYLKKDYVILSTNTFIRESGLKFRKTMTLSQIEKELGYKIKITRE